MDVPFTIRPLGDCALRVAFGDADTPSMHARLHAFCGWLAREALPGVIEWVPAFVTVGIYYRPERIGYAALCRHLETWEMPDLLDAPTPGPIMEIPVRYGGVDGPDLDDVANWHGLTAAQVIAWHAEPLYEVVMLGFLPGFPYLRGLPPVLHTPRLPAPRLRVPTGSVGIGGAQTGVYPRESPGGWRLIGRTDVRLFDVSRDPPALLTAGDRVRFVPC